MKSNGGGCLLCESLAVLGGEYEIKLAVIAVIKEKQQ